MIRPPLIGRWHLGGAAHALQGEQLQGRQPAGAWAPGQARGPRLPYNPSAPLTKPRKSRFSFSRTGAAARLLIRFFNSYGSCARS